MCIPVDGSVADGLVIDRFALSVAGYPGLDARSAAGYPGLDASLTARREGAVCGP